MNIYIHDLHKYSWPPKSQRPVLPENEQISPEKGPFQKKRLVYQPILFRGYSLVFEGVIQL